MSATLTQDSQVHTNALRAGWQLTITVSGSGYALLERWRGTVQFGSDQITAGQSPLTYAPNNLDITYRVRPFGCVVSIDQQEALTTIGTTDA